MKLQASIINSISIIFLTIWVFVLAVSSGRRITRFENMAVLYNRSKGEVRIVTINCSEDELWTRTIDNGKPEKVTSYQVLGYIPKEETPK